MRSCGRAYLGVGGGGWGRLIRRVTQVLGKGWAYLWGAICRGERGIQRKTVGRNRNLQDCYFHKNEMSFYDSVGDTLHVR